MSAAPNGNNSARWTQPVIGGVVLLFLQAFWSLAWTTINSEISKLDSRIDALPAQFVRVETLTGYRDRLTADVARIDGEISQIVLSVKDARTANLTKEEYTARHEALIADILRMSARIDELRRDLGSTYTLGDKLKDLQEQIKGLHDQLYSGRKQ